MKSLYNNNLWLGACVFVLLLTLTFSHNYEHTIHDIMVIITAEVFLKLERYLERYCSNLLYV